MITAEFCVTGKYKCISWECATEHKEVCIMACGRNREYNTTYSWQRVNYTPTNYTPVNCTQVSTANTNGCCEENCCAAYNGNGFEWMTAIQAAAQNRCGCGCTETAQASNWNNCGCGCTETAQASSRNGCGCGCTETAQASSWNGCGCGCTETEQATECCQDNEQFLIQMLRLLLHMLRRNCDNCES